MYGFLVLFTRTGMNTENRLAGNFINRTHMTSEAAP